MPKRKLQQYIQRRKVLLRSTSIIISKTILETGNLHVKVT